MTPNPIEEFRNAILASGLVAPDVIEADGRIHRFSTNGRRGDDAGWYIFHSDGLPVGTFGDWRTGMSEKWKAKGGRKLTQQESAKQRAIFDAQRRERDAAEQRGQEQTAKKATVIWQAAQPATADHGYLAKKGTSHTAPKLAATGAFWCPCATQQESSGT